jgi:hypothetical protein
LRPSRSPADRTEEHTVSWLDGSGKVLERVTGHFWEYDHLPGGFMLVPESTNVLATSARIEGMPSHWQSQIAR